MSTDASLKAIQAAFSKITHLPYCSGSVPLSETTSKLFYSSNGGSEVIDFATPSDAQLSALSESCQKATFGVKQQDVLDESYRKAGKLDASEFSLNFSPWTCGIIENIRNSLLASQHDNSSIHAELYKLNVYGPGSFFKPHIDTPRSDTMFGSLVIVLPTIHEGGSLIVRHDGHEQVFDTALAVRSATTTPQAAFVAFYSDVEHEVSLVTSGYRVTITYNLYLAKSATAPMKSLDMSNDYVQELKNALSTLLADSEFLPEGGLLGFGLSHRYPVDPSETNLFDLAERLKGSDADTINICKALSIEVSLKALYKPQDRYDNSACFLDNFAQLGGEEIVENIIRYIGYNYRGIMINRGDEDYENDEDQSVTAVVWIKEMANLSNVFTSPYIAYGNEASMGYVYGQVCLVASVAPASERNAK